MTTNQRKLRALVLSIFALAALCAPVFPQETQDGETEPTPKVTIERWLVAGPAAYPLPAFSDAATGGVEPSQLLELSILPDPRVRPAEGEEIPWFDGQRLSWKPARSKKDGSLTLRPPAGKETPAVTWLAAYLSVDRHETLELELGGAAPRRVWLDGEALASGGTDGEAETSVTAKLELAPGDHTLLLKTIRDPASDSDWTISGTIAGEALADTGRIRLTTSATRDVTLEDVIDAPRITSMALSPDGRSIVTGVTRVLPGTDDTESWVEIRNTSDGSLADTWRGAAQLSRVAWSPDGRYISYVSQAAGEGEDRSTLFLYDLAARTVRPLLERIEALGSYIWSPTGRAIVYGTTREAEKDERGVKLLLGLLDRWAGYRDKTFLNLVTVPGGSRRLLTAGELTTDALDISPDGKRLLFSRRVESLEQRPFTRTELWEMDLESFTAEPLREFLWFNDAAYGPRGERLLVAAPADAFGDAGLDVATGRISNSYDGQLFIWDPAGDAVTAITREFDPAVSQAVWNRHDGHVYLTAEQRDYQPLFRYDVEAAEFETLETGFDVNGSLTVAADAETIAVLSTSPWISERLVALDGTTGEARTLEHPSGDWFSDVRKGAIERWSFTARNGKTIDGRIYTPPGFDPDRKYPAIVYYYGGTSPVGREFGGRYPKEWWAANGYVVYVLQPSGATGFGQEFSADHVNDWGKTTTEEIIEGTKKFLEAHPFVDPARVGCIGASYGGFMTMLLSTKTDLFAGAVAHAGISSLSSYWGEGYWGFLYSAVATAESYPWNRKDIYVEQSPLFRADQNRVPILLTHGVADTNVPVGESDAFYIALKLLGKDVEYLQIEGQDHWIVDHAKRLVWSRSIVAWFDRWLKQQPAWWEALYPPDSVAAKKKPAG